MVNRIQVGRTVLVFFLLITAGQAENLYVRPDGGSYGTENGSDWNNAFDGFDDVSWGTGTGKLGAGDTLFMAGGTYTDRLEIKQGGSAGNYITIKRALASNHGTATGWNAVFDNQVVIDMADGINNSSNGIVNMANNTSHVKITGQVEDGIKIVMPSSGSLNHYGMTMKNSCSYWTLEHIEVAGPSEALDKTMRGVYSINSESHHMTFSHCRFHGISVGLLNIGGDHFVVEHCDFHDLKSFGGTTHPDLYYIRGEADSNVFRYNTVHDIRAQGVYFAGPPEGRVQRFECYGNLFYDNPNQTTVFQVDLQKYEKGSVHDFHFYNNTIYNTWCGFRIDTTQEVSGVAYNNIYSNVRFNAYNSTVHDYNWSNNDLVSGEANGLTNQADPFVDAAGGDFRLMAGSSPSNRGIQLDNPFAMDMMGMIRGADGGWDMGAFEYSSSGIGRCAEGRPRYVAGRGGLVCGMPRPDDRSRMVTLLGKPYASGGTGLYVVLPVDGTGMNTVVVVR